MMVITDPRLLLILASIVGGAMHLPMTAAAAVAVGSSASAFWVDMMTPTTHRIRKPYDQLMFVFCTIDTAVNLPAQGESPQLVRDPTIHAVG